MNGMTKVLVGAGVVIGAAFVSTEIAKKFQEKQNKNDEKNPFEGKKVIFVPDENDPENADGVRGHLMAVGNSDFTPTFYDKYVKRGLDIALSFGGLAVLSPVLLGIAAAIRIDDPGPVFFTQKRLGENKKYFRLYKFRSMKMSTPHDTPTHMLDNPEQYITRVGKFLRAHSLDELPQLLNCLDGSISVVAQRPGLWNQDLLTAERDKYGVNDLKPGITGWAQINGRDAISIEEKAKLDGYWKEHRSLGFDLKCMLGTVTKIGHDDSVVEGGTSTMARAHRDYTTGKSDQELIGHIGFGETVEVDKTMKKKVLITGAGSYIGQSFIQYAKENYPENFEIDELDMMGDQWKKADFSQYDIVYHVAGIAHADVGKVSEETKEKYYMVNTDLAVEAAKKAKEEGVKEFIFMSSMIVYGDSAPYGKKKVIDEFTVPAPANFYGDSKLQADVAVREMADENFKVIVLRPPMIYGKGSKGNYPILAKMARKLPVFPDVDNERSMLYIGNLCEFLCQIMLIRKVNQCSVVLVPQNAEWTKTSEMVQEIAEASEKKMVSLKFLGLMVGLGSVVPGKIGGLVNKAFGNNVYEHMLSQYEGINYQKISLEKSIEQSERNSSTAPKVLLLASVASMIDQFNMSNIEILQNLGYEVDVACNFEEGNTCSTERIAELKKRLASINVNYFQIDFTRKVMNLLQDMKAYEQVKKIVIENEYTFIHCHSPIGGVVGRIVAHETGTKIIYTAHGFHFFDGAPKKNWIIYYPIEKFLSKWTDILITINKEDYKRAQKEFYAQKVLYVPGIGVNTEKFDSGLIDKEEKRIDLGLGENDFLLLSVGELSERKNHKLVIEALAKLGDKNIKYYIAGTGDLKNKLNSIAEDLGVEQQIKFLGFRTDISELCQAADLFVFPSLQEGLPVALMEAIACKTPVVCSRIRGNVDLVDDDNALFDPKSVDELCKSINIKICGNAEPWVMNNYFKLKHNFEISKVEKAMTQIYGDCVEC